jgi:hypothetical protein
MSFRKGNQDKNRKQTGGEPATTEDARFTSALSAPIFNKLKSKDTSKVQIDDRFKALLTDDRFHVAPGDAVDAYGRKKKQRGSKKQDFAQQELNKLYKIEGEGEAEEKIKEKGVTGKGKGKGADGQSAEDRLDYLTRLARGEIDDSDDQSGSGSSSGDDQDSDNEEEEEEEEEEDDDELDDDVVDGFTRSALAVPGDDEDVEYGDATKRISVLHCDWENIKAEDLM